MAKSVFDKAKDERPIAKRAIQMLEGAFRNEVGDFANHIRTGSRTDNDPTRKPLRELKVKSKIRKGAVAETEGKIMKYYLNALSLDMGKHGFIQNYGVDILRQSNTVQRLRPKPTEYERRYHQFESEPYAFIDRAVRASGAVEFLAKEIGEIRGYEVLQAIINRMAENVNQTSRRPKSGGYRDRNYEW